VKAAEAHWTKHGQKEKRDCTCPAGPVVPSVAPPIKGFSAIISGKSYMFLPVTASTTFGKYTDIMVDECKQLGMKPVCDHPKFCRSDAKALYIGQKGHISLKSHRHVASYSPSGWASVRDKFEGMCLYTGNAKKDGSVLCQRGNAQAWKVASKTKQFMCGREGTSIDNTLLEKYKEKKRQERTQKIAEVKERNKKVEKYAKEKDQKKHREVLKSRLLSKIKSKGRIMSIRKKKHVKERWYRISAAGRYFISDKVKDKLGCRKKLRANTTHVSPTSCMKARSKLCRAMVKHCYPGIKPPDIYSVGSDGSAWDYCTKEQVMLKQMDACMPTPKTELASELELSFSKITLCKELTDGQSLCAVRKQIYGCATATSASSYSWRLQWTLVPFKKQVGTNSKPIQPSKACLAKNATAVQWKAIWTPENKPRSVTADVSEFPCSTLPSELIASAVV